VKELVHELRQGSSFAHRRIPLWARPGPSLNSSLTTTETIIPLRWCDT
jgi:hypothetical protein